MGGDAFQGTQKLTNEQYLTITAQLMTKLKHLCVRIQPYLPLPQKQLHGDIDFLVILKEDIKPLTIITQLALQKYIMNNNESINTVYLNKQVDYFFVQDEKYFRLASFYKSYSGIGAYLGVFLPTKQIKLTPKGLFALGFKEHIKFQYLLTEDVNEILTFYGLNYAAYQKGFKTRMDLMEYLKNVRFLDEEKFAHHQSKSPTKIMLALAEYIKQKGANYDRKIVKFQNNLEQTLNYFKKNESYKQQFTKKIEQIEQSRRITAKFNGSHILKRFNIKANTLNELKTRFREQNFKNQSQYRQWIQKNDIQVLLKKFGQSLKLQQKQQQKQK